MKAKLHSLFIALALLAGIKQAAAQGTTAFNYQDQLQDGGMNANCTYTMNCTLYDSVSDPFPSSPPAGVTNVTSLRRAWVGGDSARTGRDTVPNTFAVSGTSVS